MELNVFKLIKILTVVFLFAMNSYAFAFDDKGKIFSTITTTIVNTDNTAIYGKKGTTILNELTVSGYYKFTEQLSFAGAMNIDNPYGEKYHATLNYAFLDYTKSLDRFFDGSVRLGRTSLDFGLHKQRRNGPTSQYLIFLPFGVYWPAFNHLAQSTDGIQVELRKYIKDVGLFSFSTTYGKPIIESEDEKYITFGYFRHFSDNSVTKANGNLFSNTISFQNENWEIKYNQTSIPLFNNLNFERLREQHGDHDTEEQNQIYQSHYSFMHKFQIFGIRYSNETFYLGGEIAKHEFPTDPVGMYIRGWYQILNNTRAGFVYSKFTHLTEFPPPIPTPNWTRKGESVGISIVHNINSKTTLKAEYHKGYGSTWFPYPTSSPEWDLFAVSLSYELFRN